MSVDPEEVTGRIHGLIDEILRQKRSGRTWGKITLEVQFQDGVPIIGRVNDETTFRFVEEKKKSKPDV